MRLGVPARAALRTLGLAIFLLVPSSSLAAGTLGFLPNDAVLARVEDRVIRASDFVTAYFSSYAEHRPRPDSAGRVEFLNSMVSKEILGLTAMEAQKPLTFEDRHMLREHEQRTLSNVLYQRMVLDSITVTEEQIRETYKQFLVRVRARHICLAERPLAEKVRLELISGGISWNDAVRKYSTLFRDDNPAGDMGWLLRVGADAEMGEEVFTLQPGGISPPLEDPDGYHLIQVLEREPVDAPGLESLRAHIENGLRGLQMAALSARLQAALAKSVHMTYDTAAIRFAAGRFAPPRSFERGELSITGHVPEFSPEDTARVLARFDGGTYTLGQFLTAYSAVNPLARPAVNTVEGMIGQIHAGALEPQRVAMARSLGLDRDSLTLASMKNRLEQLRVEQMYQDSILSRIWVSSEDRRDYYTANLTDFFTYPSVRYVSIVTGLAPLADSLVARLRSGDDPESLLEEQVHSGRASGAVQTQYSHPPGPNHNLLFEVMRPGDTERIGPDRGDNYAVIHLIERDGGRQLEFDEVQSIIDESLQNLKAEQALKELIARHRIRYQVEVHPELVMRVRLVDPAGVTR